MTSCLYGTVGASSATARGCSLLEILQTGTHEKTCSTAHGLVYAWIVCVCLFVCYDDLALKGSCQVSDLFLRAT